MDWSKFRSSLRRDSHKASDWEYRNRTSLYMVCFGASLYITHHHISYVLVHHYIIMHHYISCVLVHHYIIMHHYISCVFVYHYISCITIYHKSLYIMHPYISCVLVHHYIIIRHYIPCVYWCIIIYQASLYMMRFGMVGQKWIFASLLRELVFGAGVEKYFGAFLSTSTGKIYIWILSLYLISQAETVYLKIS